MTATSSTTSAAAFLIEGGNKLIEAKTKQKNSDAADAVMEIFALVAAGKLDISVLDRLIEFSENPVGFTNNNAPAISAGTSNSEPPATAPTFTDRSALEHLLNSPSISDGKKKALQKILADPTDTLYMEVHADGTPAIVKSLEGQVATKTREAASSKADVERLTNELSTAKQTPAAPVAPESMAKAEVFKIGDKLNELIAEHEVKDGVVRQVPKGAYVFSSDVIREMSTEIKKIETPKPKAKAA